MEETDARASRTSGPPVGTTVGGAAANFAAIALTAALVDVESWWDLEPREVDAMTQGKASLPFLCVECRGRD